MATIRTKFRPSSVEGREGTLYFQIIHGRVARQINTGYKIFPSEWDEHASEIILSVSDDARRSLLLALKERMKKDVRRLESIIAGLERSGGTYPADRVVEFFHNPPPADSYNFMAFGKRLVEELERVGKKRTAERYTTVLNSFTRFWGRDGDIPLEDIGSTLMLEYEAWLKDKGICPNSTSYYMRNLRAVYNRAVDKERKYSINSLVYWVTYVHNVVYSFYRSMIYCYINSTQRCAGSIVIDIIPTNGADKRKFFPFAPYFPVTNVIKRYFYPYFPAIIGIKGYSFPYFPYLSGIMKIKTALYSLFSRLDWHKTVVFPCLGEIYEGIRSLSWEIPVT